MEKRQTMRLTLEKTVLGVDSDYDAATKPAADYRAKNVYPEFRDQGFEVVILRGKLARRHFVATEARKPQVVMLTGIGHGLFDLYTGDQGQAIWRVGQYEREESNGRIAHFLSCQTARDLGPDLVKNGCRAYFGYDVNFVFNLERAEIFFECDSEIDRALAQGATARQAYQRAVDLYNQRIQQADDAGHPYIASLLETDRDHLCAPSVDSRWGDTSARL